MVGNYNLRVRVIAPKDNMAAALTLELKSLLQKRGDALPS
jgi:hypothetical protein